MAKKNKWLIEAYKAQKIKEKRLEEATNTNVAQIYACFAKVLIEEYKHTPEWVEKLFVRTQICWDEMVQNEEVDSMVDWCEKATGIDLRMGN